MEELGRHSRPGENLICRTCRTQLCKYLQSQWQLVIFFFYETSLHFMYNFQVLFCSITQNDAGCIYDFKPTVEHKSLVLPAL